MLVKSISENLLLLMSLFFEKFYKLGIIGNVQQKCPILMIILNYGSNSVFVLLFSLTLIISFNRYLACAHPIKYKIIFDQSIAKKIIIGIILFSIVVSLFLYFFGNKNREIKSENVALEKSTRNLSVVAIVLIIGFYIPVVLLSCIFNFLMILRVKKKDFKKVASKSTQSLFYYSLFTLANFIMMLIMILGRTFDTFINIFPNEKIVNQVNSITFEVGTFGSFFGSLLLSPQLRNIFFVSSKLKFIRTNANTNVIVIPSIRHSYNTTRIKK